MSPSSTITAFLLYYFFFFIGSLSGQTFITPITKDNTTNLYTISIYLNTPLKLSKLHLDLGSYFPWYDCGRHYKTSPSYRPIFHNSTLCDEVIPNSLGNCFRRPSPGCANASCGFLPENPTNRDKSTAGDLITDKFSLPTESDLGRPGPVSDLVFACTDVGVYSHIYRGMARGAAGLAALGRYNHSLPAQLSKSFSLPQVFAVCLPSSSDAPGLVWFSSPGPYYFAPGLMDLSKSLIYTPLKMAPVSSETLIYWYYPSPEYYLDVTAIRVNGKAIPLNKTLLNITEIGWGGAKISSSRAYSVLQSSIFQAVKEVFVKELKLTPLKTAIKPFEVCYASGDIGSSISGPRVPAIDLVLQNGKIWRIYGSNSMVRVTANNIDAWCLGIIDGGENPRTSITVGAHQFQDNLLQIDLERGRLGFSSSLLLRGTNCSSFRFAKK